MTNHVGRVSVAKSILACVLSGVLLGLSQPVYFPGWLGKGFGAQNFFGALSLIGYIPLFLLIARKNLKATFGWSFFAVTVQYTLVLYWIYYALHIHGDIPTIAAAIITLLLPMMLALKATVFLTIGRFLSIRFGQSFFFIAPIALTAAEYFRNFYIFGGFPWGNVGYSIGRIDQFLQFASVVGVYGLVFFVALVNALICVAITQSNRRRRLGVLVATLAIVLLSLGYGTLRLLNSENEFAPTLRVALLQGNIAQELKQSARLHAKDILDIYFDLSRRAKSDGAELVIWPESAYPRVLRKDISEFNFSFEDRIASIVGAVVYGEDPDGEDFVHNSGFLIDYRGQIVKRYDKSHLVPFGEYVPWPLSGVVDQIVPGLGAFRPGIKFEPTTLAISEAKRINIGTTVCYEGIFPEISRAYAKEGADLLVNLTNDAWYGLSSAPYQHLLMYRMRSVESGLPFVRATNTGVSAWIDAFGNLHQGTELFTRGAVVANVPLLKKKTLYRVSGDVIPILSLLILIVLFVMAVLPVHHFLRQRQWHKLLIILVLSSVALSSHIYFQHPQFLTDESARTKNLLIFLFCLVLMIGLLGKTARSRMLLLVASLVLTLISVALAIVESVYFLFGAIVGLLIYLLASRIRESDKPTK